MIERVFLLHGDLSVPCRGWFYKQRPAKSAYKSNALITHISTHMGPMNFAIREVITAHDSKGYKNAEYMVCLNNNIQHNGN